MEGLLPEGSKSSSENTPKVIPSSSNSTRKFFECSDCGLHEEFDYYGKTPPFCKSIIFAEASYVAKDPFTSSSGNNANFLLLGSDCAVCKRMTCQECSIFFTKRFCAHCTRVYSSELPEELRTKKKAKD